jgi:ferredoxin/flavodoxin---NADP+ reductase
VTHIITRACCNDAAGVPVCPFNCIHPTPDEPDYGTAEMLYIDPDGCIDCQACVDVCPVGAIVADYDLAPELARFEEINARYFAAPERSDYEATAQPLVRRDWAGVTATPLRVAVIGSGPAACYAAEEVLGQRGLDAEVDMFERLPTPGGLVRFGVAPDHQDTKGAAEAFARTMKRNGFRLFLNAEVGTGISLEQLQLRYHAVVVAAGAMGDRQLGVPGEDLPGSHSATEFVAWYNGHPDFSGRTFDLSAERAVIIGNGNVALDVARILTSDPDELARTDIADHALAQLRESKVREVVVVGRRGPAEAAFSVPEVIGLSQTQGVDIVVRPDELAVDDSTLARIGDPASSVPWYKVKLLEELGTGAPTHERRIVLRFLASPLEITGDGWVEGVRLTHNRLVDRDGRTVAEPTGDIEQLAAGLVFRSVGYKGQSLADLPFDDDRGVIPNDGGRIVGADGRPIAGLYVAGWIKRGPSGVIGTNKRCARETVAALFDDFVAGTLPRPRGDNADVATLLPEHIDLGGWRQIDQRERQAGKEQRRPRVKLVERAGLLETARAAE